MSWIFIILAVYLGVAAAIWLWDGFIGFGERFDESDSKNLEAICVLWPLVGPFFAFMSINDYFRARRKKRMFKAQQKKKLRVAAELEEKKILEEVERELEEEQKRVGQL